MEHFDRVHSDFAIDARNVRLGLCTNEFNPNRNNGIPYSYWPVFITVYNLHPSMCMKTPCIFMSLLIPGPKSPTSNINVFLRPLVNELKVLWKDGINTWDIHRKQNFQIRAALLWTISDFPAYGMLSGWSTHGRLACPYSMDKSKAFVLQNGRKVLFFYCSRMFLSNDHLSNSYLSLSN
ncbi:hypothetical protein AXF42_Ash009884 [Apostasia shenzhenica]|uniref:Uncharacterized protein n=1 Tax=Apostasia shenzhenica TaxID=1088818 RepID=A0A2I0AC84_9ASPA|nr:hypothetical protein AXF42_Ash009884 [Apostasia shenzhenica]